MFELLLIAFADRDVGRAEHSDASARGVGQSRVVRGRPLTMRVWSAFDIIPRALAFENADPGAIDH